MLSRMTEPEITGWVSKLDEIHALLAPRTDERVEEPRRRALAAVAELHSEMLRAEVRAVIGGVRGRRV